MLAPTDSVTGAIARRSLASAKRLGMWRGVLDPEPGGCGDIGWSPPSGHGILARRPAPARDGCQCPLVLGSAAARSMESDRKSLVDGPDLLAERMDAITSGRRACVVPGFRKTRRMPMPARPWHRRCRVVASRMDPTEACANLRPGGQDARRGSRPDETDAGARLISWHRRRRGAGRMDPAEAARICGQAAKTLAEALGRETDARDRSVLWHSALSEVSGPDGPDRGRAHLRPVRQDSRRSTRP